MRFSFFHLPAVSHAARYGPTVIAAGLAVLLAQGYWPAAPVVTGLALVALGATCTTIRRYRSAVALRGGVAVHLFVYASLYVLLIGAVCHGAMAAPQSGLTLLQGFDLGVSAGVMAMVVRLSFGALAGGEDAPAR